MTINKTPEDIRLMSEKETRMRAERIATLQSYITACKTSLPRMVKEIENCPGNNRKNIHGLLLAESATRKTALYVLSTGSLSEKCRLDNGIYCLTTISIEDTIDRYNQGDCIKSICEAMTIRAMDEELAMAQLKKTALEHPLPSQ